MKKICCFCLVLLLCVSISGISLAADEIIFRGIPWARDYATVIESLSDGTIAWKTPSSTMGKLIKNEIDEMSSNYDQNHQCVYVVNSDSKHTSLSVAGYKVNDIKLYFAFTPNTVGEIDHKVANTSFYMAKYTIKPTDYDVATNDLKQKLTKLYGSPKYIESANTCSSGDSKYPRWEGANGSFVALTAKNSSYSDPEIYIYYGNDMGDDMIKVAENLQKQAEANDLKNAGTDGL